MTSSRLRSKFYSILKRAKKGGQLHFLTPTCCQSISTYRWPRQCDLFAKDMEFLLCGCNVIKEVYSGVGLEVNCLQIFICSSK